MGRPSIKRRRSREILDAYETCVARHGVEGATLERVAAEAGLARSLIRHNVGNRADLLDALVARFLSNSETRTAEMIAGLPEHGPVPALIDRLFDRKQADVSQVLVAEALIAAAADNPKLAARLGDWVGAFVDAIAQVLEAAVPDAAKVDIEAVAAGITGIYFNVDSLASLGDPGGLRSASKRAALMLAVTLAAS